MIQQSNSTEITTVSSAPLLRVAEWDTRYENNRTRPLKRLDWVPMPNKHDGDGYTQLVDHPDGAAHYGCWSVTVQVASKCHPRGTLVRDGGEPHTAASLARMTRLHVDVFNAAIPRLLEIGWLEVVPQDDAIIAHCDAEISHGDAVTTQADADNGHLAEFKGSLPSELSHGTSLPESGTGAPKSAYEGNRSEGNGKNGTDAKGNEAGERVGSFQEFQNAYPECKRGSHVEMAAKAYASRVLGKSGEHEKLMAGLAKYVRADHWTRSIAEDSGRFIPSMRRFVEEGLYNDTPQPAHKTNPPANIGRRI